MRTAVYYGVRIFMAKLSPTRCAHHVSIFQILTPTFFLGVGPQLSHRIRTRCVGKDRGGGNAERLLDPMEFCCCRRYYRNHGEYSVTAIVSLQTPPGGDGLRTPPLSKRNMSKMQPAAGEEKVDPCRSGVPMVYFVGAEKQFICFCVGTLDQTTVWSTPPCVITSDPDDAETWRSHAKSHMR